jgi:hypothetical protein
MHAHRDMEIITYLLEGALAHQDSMGNGSIIRPGEGQRMSAGSGVRHSEANPSKTEEAHLLQIWILPDRKGHQPGYEQKAFPESEKRGKLRLIASPDGQDGSVTINQDARLYATQLKPGQQVRHDLSPGRHAWLQVAKGAVELNGQTLNQGYGAAVSEEKQLAIKGNADARSPAVRPGLTPKVQPATQPRTPRSGPCHLDRGPDVGRKRLRNHPLPGQEQALLLAGAKRAESREWPVGSRSTAERASAWRRAPPSSPAPGAGLRPFA